MYERQLDPEYVHKKSVDLENPSKRNNLGIDGIIDKGGESWDNCEVEVENRFTEKLVIEEKIITKRANGAKKRKTAKQINQEQLSVHY